MQYTSRETYENISQKINDLIKTRTTCAVSGKDFPVYESDATMRHKLSPTFDGETFTLPAPTLCPEERSKRRQARRNEKSLYRRKCDVSGKSLISIYSPDKDYTIIDSDIRWSDSWDPLDHGQKPAEDKTFFEQFDTLLHAIPRA